MKKRGFEVAKGFEDRGINLPLRATRTSAGFDFEAGEEVTIPPVWWMIAKAREQSWRRNKREKFDYIRTTKVSTGIKCYMMDDEVLYLYNRSSNPFKKMLFLADGVGVIDSDYYENETNDGNIFFQFINFGFFPVTVKKGERIGQGVFSKFLDADEGKARKSNKKRIGGSGTT